MQMNTARLSQAASSWIRCSAQWAQACSGDSAVPSRYVVQVVGRARHGTRGRRSQDSPTAAGAALPCVQALSLCDVCRVKRQICGVIGSAPPLLLSMQRDGAAARRWRARSRGDAPRATERRHRHARAGRPGGRRAPASTPESPSVVDPFCCNNSLQCMTIVRAAAASRRQCRMLSAGRGLSPLLLLPALVLALLASMQPARAEFHACSINIQSPPSASVNCIPRNYGCSAKEYSSQSPDPMLQKPNPGLAWSKVDHAASYTVVMEDSTMTNGAAISFVQWIVQGIPANGASSAVQYQVPATCIFC